MLKKERKTKKEITKNTNHTLKLTILQKNEISMWE